MKITLTYSENNRLFVSAIDDEGNRIYWTNAKGKRTGSLPLTRNDNYPGYLEWALTRIRDGHPETPKVSDWRRSCTVINAS